MAFRPGQSGNPGGRPRVVGYVQELARQHSETAINALVEIMNDKKAPPAARVSAASAVLDRGYGKPPQYTAVATDDKRDVTDWTTEELLAFLNESTGGQQ